MILRNNRSTITLISIVIASVAFSFCFAQSGDSLRTIIVEIMHGSKPKKHTNGYKVLGGYFGGHTVIQIDTFVYGFNYFGPRVHIFPHRKKRNGIYQKQTLKEWSKLTEGREMTYIYIPLTKEKYEELRDAYENYYLNCPHDYAFFGMRCAASAYWMLGNAGVLKKCSRRKSIIHSFHPKMFRKKMVRIAKKKGYRIMERKGSESRKWEGY